MRALLRLEEFVLFASLCVVGCAQSHGRGPDASARRDAGPFCACPCSDPAAACVGALGTRVALVEFTDVTGRAITAHRSTRVPLTITYHPAQPYPDRFRAALAAWQRDCPGSLRIGSMEPEEVHERVECQNQLHFGVPGLSVQNCVAGSLLLDGTGRIGDACAAWSEADGESSLLHNLGLALGFRDAPSGTGSIMEPRETRPSGLTALDREAFCAAYADGGFCGD